MDTTKPVFTIRIAAEITGLHPQTLRVYEQKGLICPARSDGGTRMYSSVDIELIEEIRELSDAGVGTEGISIILGMRERIAQLERENNELRAENQCLRSVSSNKMTSIVVRGTLPKILIDANEK